MAKDGAGRRGGAVEKYIRMPAAYLKTPFFRSLSVRQRDVFELLLMYAAMDKGTPAMQVRVSMATIGDDLDMDRAQVSRVVDALIEKGAVVKVSTGGGRSRNTYELAEPVRVRLVESVVLTPDDSTTASCVDAQGSTQTEMPLEIGGKHGGEQTGVDTQGSALRGACVDTQGSALYISPNKGELSSGNSPLVGTGRVGRNGNPICPRCHTAELQPIGRLVKSPKDPSKLACPFCQGVFERSRFRERVIGGQDRAAGDF